VQLYLISVQLYLISVQLKSYIVVPYTVLLHYTVHIVSCILLNEVSLTS